MSDFYQNLTKNMGLEINKLGIGVTSIVGLIFNLFMCFFGYRFMKIIIAIIGFIAGSSIAYYFISKVSMADSLKILIAVIIGLLIASVAYALYKLGIFIMCSVLAFSVIYLVLSSSLDSTLNLLISGVAGLLIGSLAIYFVKPVTIISTSISGGVNTIFAIFTLCNYSNNTLGIILGLLLAIFGIYFQFKDTKNISAQ